MKGCFGFFFSLSVLHKLHKPSVNTTRHVPTTRSPLSIVCPPCSRSCLHGTQVGRDPHSACQINHRAVSLGRSRSCQTAWTPLDLKVRVWWISAEDSVFSTACSTRFSHDTLTCHRTSEHGRSDADESPSRNGRHGPTGS